MQGLVDEPFHHAFERRALRLIGFDSLSRVLPRRDVDCV